MSEYKLPEPEAFYEGSLGQSEPAFSEDQMQQAYQAGRDSMKAECVKAVHNCLNDYVFTADMAGHAGRHLQLAENAINAIREQLGEKA